MLVMVRSRAITFESQRSVKACMMVRGALTIQRQPYELEAEKRENGQGYPEGRLRIQCQPKEPLIRSCHSLATWLVRLRRTLKNPMAVASLCIDLVPPPQSHQASTRYVLEVVEVHGKEDDGDDEDEDEVVCEYHAQEIDQERC